MSFISNDEIPSNKYKEQNYFHPPATKVHKFEIDINSDLRDYPQAAENPTRDLGLLRPTVPMPTEHS